MLSARRRCIVRSALKFSTTVGRKSFIETNKFKFLLGGLGTGLAVAGYYAMTPQKTLVKSIKSSFDLAYGYSAKLFIFSRVPEPKIPPPDVDGKQMNLEEWSKFINDTASSLSGSLMVKTYKYMYDTLLNYIEKEIPDIEQRLQEYKNVMSLSTDLNVAIDDEFDKELKTNKWIKASLLEQNNVGSQTKMSIESQLIKGAILLCPNIDECFALIHETKTVDQIVNGIGCSDELKENLKKSFGTIKEYYDKLNPKIKNMVTLSIAETLMEKINSTDPIMLDVILDKHLVARMNADEFVKPVVPYIKSVIKSLPPKIQARVLLTAYKKYDNELCFLKSVLSSAGLVTVKLGQILSEDPKVPPNYRDVLSDLRGTNEPMSPTVFWNAIPEAIRANISELGKCIGVGSVKQVHLVKMKDGKIKVIAIVKKDSINYTVAALKALGHVKQIEGLVDRIRKTVYREMDLWLEYEAFEMLRKTSLGRNSKIVIPKVDEITLDCIVRDLAEGPTLAKLFGDFTEFKKSEDKYAEIIESIKCLHKNIIHLAFEERLVLSDMHFDNVAYHEGKCILFDPGQYSKLNKEQSTALLWTIASISTTKRMTQLESMTLNHLADVSSFKSGVEGNLRKSLKKAYDTCYEIKEPNERFKQLLIATEAEGIKVPNGFFSCAKMLDTLTSQEILLGLPHQTEQMIADMMWKRMSWSEVVMVAFK